MLIHQAWNFLGKANLDEFLVMEWDWKKVFKLLKCLFLIFFFFSKWRSSVFSSNCLLFNILLKNQCKPCSSQSQRAWLQREKPWRCLWLHEDPTFHGCEAGTLRALTSPGISVWSLGLYCWHTSRRIALFHSKYMTKTAQVYCTAWQSCIMAQGMTNGSFCGMDRFFVSNEDLSVQKWQGCSCWLILTCFLSLVLFPFCTPSWSSPLSPSVLPLTHHFRPLLYSLKMIYCHFWVGKTWSRRAGRRGIWNVYLGRGTELRLCLLWLIAPQCLLSFV